MKVSIEVGHPSHVHYWRNVIRLLRERGHSIELLARKKETTLQILKAYGLDFTVVGSSKPTLVWKALDLLFEDMRVLRLAQRKGVDFMMSTGIPSAAHASRILGVPHVSLIDTEVARLGRLLVEPFSDAVCTPACFQGKVDPLKHIRFKGYLELMYLHPNYFRQDPSVLDGLGIRKGDPLAVVRFSSWDSSHDIGRTGSVLGSDAERYELVKELARSHRVFLTSEIALPKGFEQYRLTLPPERFHDLLAFASLYVGDGAKTASEAGVLGVPWVYLSRSRRGYLDDQEKKYGLGRTVQSLQEARECLGKLSTEYEPKKWEDRRRRLLDESTDVTKFMAELVDRWPESRDSLLAEG